MDSQTTDWIEDVDHIMPSGVRQIDCNARCGIPVFLVCFSSARNTSAITYDAELMTVFRSSALDARKIWAEPGLVGAARTTGF